MPDTMIMAAVERPTKISTAAEMAALWKAYQEAKGAFEAAIRIKDNGTPETMSAFQEAQQAIMDAHTVDLAGIAIKLKVLRDRDADDAINGMIQDLEEAPASAPPPMRPGAFLKQLVKAALPAVDQEGDNA